MSAKIQATLGNKRVAVEALNAIDEDDPQAYEESLWLAAKWLIELGEVELSQRKLLRMLDLPGDHIRVHRQLAQLLNNQGRRIEAAEHLRALARSGKILEKELFAMANYSNPFIDDSLPKPNFGKGLVPGMLAVAREVRSQRDVVGAAELLERLADAFPESTQISAFLGRTYADLQDDENLIRWVKSTPIGIEREPEYWHTLGVWMQSKGRHREAIRCFAEAVIRDETDRGAYFALARSLNLVGETDASQLAMQRAEDLNEATAIARKLGRERGTKEELNRMAELLQVLGRPWEALAWRSIALKQSGGSEGEREIEKQRNALANLKDDSPNVKLLACGLDLAQWPLPSAEQIGAMVSVDNVPRPDQIAGDVAIEFKDVAAEVGLHFQYDNGDDPSDDTRFLHQLTGGGIGVIDFDRDGWSDLYMTQGGGHPFDAEGSKPNSLFRNLEGSRWSEVTSSTATGDLGYGQGVAVADLNQDGFPDIVVANIGPNVLYLNNGDGSFARRNLVSATTVGDWTTSIGCGDLSGDALPEIVEVNYVDDPLALKIPCTAETIDCNPSEFQPAIDRVWQINSDGRVTSWEGCREIDQKPNYGFGLVIANFDESEGNDVFIANDTRPNHFWKSQPSSGADAFHLIENAQLSGCATGDDGLSRGCMGVALGDFDRNHRMDLHITNFWHQPADIYLQQPAGFFQQGNQKLGVFQASRETVGWGTQAVDIDRNGWQDLVVLNGHVTNARKRGQPFEMRPQLFRGNADGFTLMEPNRASGQYWYDATLGRTLAVLDWNRDSKPDLIANHLDAPVALLENQTSGGNSIQFKLVGTKSERDAVGATLALTCGDQQWTGWLLGGHGFLCSNEQMLDFGVGSVAKIDRVEVHWPSGIIEEFANLDVNQRYLIVEGDGLVFASP
jgi:tetratricopeptide (TPR) repeat protein